ncbi:rhodanese-like domain-containing protein [Pantoea sp. Mhis]|uniref:rhodanese-like domain-containing protein n=1 Tax=Pantoea sp. Mhis TaxID=2576759 RepID=UPI00135A1FE3|nr:rhodanese-like domain-containing protein [Pantoea sp. Mhis]MXP56647.1 rhodanese-like domain-containing protein [Pantoea sp. Mhis]
MQEIIEFINRHVVLSAIWVMLLISLILNLIKRFFLKVKIINCIEAICLINKEDAIVVDIRFHNDYNKGHITGALNITEPDIKKGILGKLEKNNLKPIIIVCNTGNNAINSAMQLKSMGFIDVYVLRNGMNAWIDENLPLVRM